MAERAIRVSGRDATSDVSAFDGTLTAVLYAYNDR
jgi:hypothetical protein